MHIVSDLILIKRNNNKAHAVELKQEKKTYSRKSQ